MLSQLLKSWSVLHQFNPTSEQAIQEESLWYNSALTIDKEQICWRVWLNAGITLVNDILHSDLPRFLSHEELSAKYGIKVSFLQVLQIRSSLPFTWRRMLTNLATQNITPVPKIVSNQK